MNKLNRHRKKHRRAGECKERHVLAELINKGRTLLGHNPLIDIDREILR